MQWTRITEHIEEGRVTWAMAVVGKVLAQGECRSTNEARRQLAEAIARLEADRAPVHHVEPQPR